VIIRFANHKQGRICKKLREISIGNFRLRRARRSNCHKFHSREPREACGLIRRERYGTGDKDEKSVNGIQISIGKFRRGKRDYLFRNSVYSGKFSVEHLPPNRNFRNFLVNGKRFSWIEKRLINVSRAYTQVKPFLKPAYTAVAADMSMWSLFRHDKCEWTRFFSPFELS